MLTTIRLAIRALRGFPTYDHPLYRVPVDFTDDDDDIDTPLPDWNDQAAWKFIPCECGECTGERKVPLRYRLNQPPFRNG